MHKADKKMDIELSNIVHVDSEIQSSLLKIENDIANPKLLSLSSNFQKNLNFELEEKELD